MHLDPNQLRALITDTGLVSRADFDAAFLEADSKGTNVGEILVSQGKITEDDFRRLESYLLGIPFVDLKKEKVDFAVLSVIPEPIARKHNIVAFKKKGKDLEVAMLDPQDIESIDFIKKRSGLTILARLTDRESIRTMLLQYQKSLKAEFGDMIKKDTAELKMVAEESDTPEGDLKKMAEDVPIVRVVDTLLNHAILQQASDIHIEPYEKEVVIRYRIDGMLHDAMILPRAVAPGITARIKVLSNLRLDEKRLPQDGRFKIEHGEEGEPQSRVSFRVSTLPTYFGEKVVMRLLPETSAGLTLEGLGFHGEAAERIHRATKQTTGLILVTGPTGSGKSTTLYTILDILNTPSVNICTIEDPIEYQISRINQTQVKPEIGLTFASGLRTLMRQDPNIIMVGEIRDSETASLAINASLTGHLVLSTLHTNSASGSIPRLLDMKVEPFLLVSTINVIVAQRLVRKLAQVHEEYILDAAELEQLKKHADLDRVLQHLKDESVIKLTDDWTTIRFFRPKVSPDAPDGYSGRGVISEVLTISRTIKDLVMRSATADEIHDQARGEGMLTIVEDGVFQAVRGVTSIEEVLRVANE
ncbi:MAG: GspE/PulE family protein [Patescibacteria group bacterium]